MGRMQVGRFENRAAALDFLVEKYSIKKFPARYSITESVTASVSFRFLKTFPGDKQGEVQHVGNGLTVSAAIVDLFQQLSEDIEALAEGAST
jgi:hypothetical protein